MSHTITRSRRFSRIAAGLTVAAAATATTLLGASPASAATPILVRMSGTTMIITGTTIGDRASTTGSTSAVIADSSSGPVAAGTGCQQQSGAAVLCIGVSSIRFSGRSGNDVFRNGTAVPSDLFGEAGNDQLIGGSGRDFIRGGGDQDAASGQGGTDDCIAEIVSTCEA